MQDFKKDNYLLGEEGKQYALEGSPEVNFFLAVPVEGISLANLKVRVVLLLNLGLETKLVMIL